MTKIRIDPESFEPVARSVYRQLREAILLGVYPPGTRLNERELSEEIQVSRTPIREAFRFLEKEGLMRHSPRRGVEVVGLSRRDIDGIYAMRVLLDGLAAQLAAEQITDEVLEEMRLNIEQTVASVDDFTTDQYIRCQDDFNHLIDKAAGHQHLTFVLEGLRLFIKSFRVGTFSRGGRRMQACEEHRAIYEALRERNPAKARTAVEIHGRSSLATFKRFLQE
jgi:DNA-binding GntR family transcriptional regulator